MDLMQRFTISLDDALAEQFDALIAGRGYDNRSEAVRDLIRERIGAQALSAEHAPWCVANVSYVYDHHDRTVTERVMALQHDHHDMVVSSLHTHLDHHHCLETVVLRGAGESVREFAARLMALRGVRHGQMHLVPLAEAPGSHRHGKKGEPAHRHFHPVN